MSLLILMLSCNPPPSAPQQLLPPTLAERVVAGQYRMVETPAGVRARHPDLDLVVDFEHEKSEFLWNGQDFSMRTVALNGRPLHPAPARLGAELTREDVSGEPMRRVERKWPGLLEWWENQPEGLEQGFVVDQPASAGADGELWLDLALNQVRVQVVASDMAELELVGGDQMVYEGLLAWDAAGEILSSHLEEIEGGLRLVVEVEQAVWPVYIDPVVTSADLRLNGGKGENFGLALASGDANCDGYDDLLVGARYYSSTSFSNEGAAYLFLGGPSGLSTTAVWSASDANQTNANFGRPVALTDYTGDGCADVLVGAYRYDDGGVTDSGAVWRYAGASVGPTTVGTKISSPSPQAGAYFGFGLAGVGDVSSDGVGDVVIGAYGYDGNVTEEGRAYFYLGSTNGPVYKRTLSPVAGVQNFGYSITPIRLNSDALSDVVIGAASNAGFEGGAYVFLGKTGDITSSASSSVGGTAVASGFGTAVVSADVDGDGDEDLIVGAYAEGVGAVTVVGQVHVYLNQRGTFPATEDILLSGDTASGQFGLDLANVGDVNGDGLDDVAVGAAQEMDSYSKEGRTHVFLGSSSLAHGSVWTADWIGAAAAQNSAYYGRAVVGGDIDGDGYSDLAVGAYGWDFSQAYKDVGAVYIHYGPLQAASSDSDSDGDPDSTDCDSSNAAVYTGAPESCNGFDDNCDGTVDENTAVNVQTWYADTDGDGYGDAASSLLACTAPVGYVIYNTDCDDSDGLVSPAGIEVCNGLDDDCDLLTDEGNLAPATWYLDADSDGYGTAAGSVISCVKPAGYVSLNTDCDDQDASRSPGETESCNGIDDNCDGVVDDGSGAPPTWYLDDDGDGYGDPAQVYVACAAPPSYVADNTDCDDQSAAVSPGDVESCNSVDDDCNGVVDDDATDAGSIYVDTDGDGFGDPAQSLVACSAAGYVADGTDCDDRNNQVSPASPEQCFNAVDDDCDGTVDGANGVGAGTWYPDVDRDGVGDSSMPLVACTVPAGHGALGGDCDDYNAMIHPGATEFCNGVDDDCDGVADGATAANATVAYADVDGDGYGDVTQAQTACPGSSGLSTNGLDCDDLDAAVHPAAAELWYDGVDQDCDTNDCDRDGDGRDCDPTVSACGSCLAGPIADDCNDADGAVSPIAAEIWYNGVDENCDQNDCDQDGDGHSCSPLSPTCMACPSTGDDCNDLDSFTYAEGEELWYNGIDENCDGKSDYDQDGDGYEHSRYGGPDCNDDPEQGGAAVHPAAAEVWYDGVDQDCDGANDYDQDGDGHNTFDQNLAGTNAGDDCNDEDPSRYPGAIEGFYDGIDRNCDGANDYDADGDGSAGMKEDGSAGPDCNDSNDTVYPGAPESCDAVDSDCDGKMEDEDDDGCLCDEDENDEDSGDALCHSSTEEEEDSTPKGGNSSCQVGGGTAGGLAPLLLTGLVLRRRRT